jgi:hypothetical protein
MAGLDPAALSAALQAVDHLWSLPSRFAETGAHHGYRQITIALAGRVEVPAFAAILDQFAPVRSAWLSMLEPGGYIVEHIDAGPYYERWQLPFTTGSYGSFTQQAGVPFPVRHYDWHHVTNDTDEPRISLVIDRDVPLPIPSAPFSRRPT